MTDCSVTSSSGSSALDQATCRILRSRARFTPARDSSGNPTTGSDTRQRHLASPGRLRTIESRTRLSLLNEKELDNGSTSTQQRRRRKSLWLHRRAREGGIIAWVTFGILVIMSVGSWYIFFVKLIEQQKIIKEGRRARTSFWQSANLREGANKLDKNGAYRQIVDDGLLAEEQHNKLTDPIDQHDWMLELAGPQPGRDHRKLSTGLAFLATVGSTAPFVGLFGTVVGIYRALIKIGAAGQASIDAVAGPVGEALIMTALGLVVAVPAVMQYNWLMRRNKAIGEELARFANDVHGYMMSGGAVRPVVAGRGARRGRAARPARPPGGDHRHRQRDRRRQRPVRRRIGGGAGGAAALRRRRPQAATEFRIGTKLMAMQVGEAGGEEDTPMSDINTTPLVDVMLVLLIIFLIAVPVVLQTVPVQLPKVEFEPTTDQAGERQPDGARRTGGECEVYWGLTRLNSEQLLDRAVASSRTRSRQSAASRTSPRRICRRRISAATSTRPIAASAARSSPCSAPASPGSASFPSRRRGGGVAALSSDEFRSNQI